MTNVLLRRTLNAPSLLIAPRYSILMTLTVVGAWVSSSYGQSTLDYPVGQLQPYDVDSGARDNQAEAFETVFENLVQIEDAAWLRIYFGEVTLAEGSYIRMTSLRDGEVQELDARELAMWSNSSAYFNGNALQVELIAGPGTEGNRVIIEQVAHHARGRHAAGGPGQCGICGGDNRVPSNELWSGRLLPVGCTASVWNQSSCLVSAGHCMTGGLVIQFNVPDSSPGCFLNNPPLAEQFPVQLIQSNNGGVGNDWAVMTSGTNNLGQTIYERYGELRPISDVVGSVGQTVGVWGYGVDNTCTRTLTQQTDSGPIAGVFSNFYEFSVDVRSGNSGSGLIRNDEIIGVVTHCPCPNIATRVDRAAFTAARDALCPGEDGTTPLPFFDDFPSTTIDPDLWTGIDGAAANSSGDGEPSTPLSLNLDSSDEIRSAKMNTSGNNLMVVSYWWQRTGFGGSPSPGEDLFVEFINAADNWIELNMHPGDGPDDDPYQFVEIPLPTPARHAEFRLRFRATGNASNDDWFVDDVFVGTPPEDATTPLPFIDEFPSTEINSDLWIGIEGASIDDQGDGEPSAPFSLNIDGVDEIRSANMDTTGGATLALTYWWQQGGGEAEDDPDAPEVGDDLIVEYLNDMEEWVEINRHLGDGTGPDPYEQASLPLPADAQHGSFRFRFRGTGTTGGQPAGHDDWFIDKVCVGTAAECQSGQACDGPEDCDDGVPCTADDCQSNFCLNLPIHADCDDGVACTADACVIGSGCENTPDDGACDDGNDCTLDSCNAGSGCVNAPDGGQPCDDGMECTINDTCDAEGLCIGEGDGCVVLEAGFVNLPICQDTGQDYIDVPLAVCKIYVHLTSIDDRLLSTGNSEITTTDPNGFFQHPLNPSVIAPYCPFVSSFPDLVCDSFITIGLDCGPEPAGTDKTAPDGDFNAFEFANNGHLVGGWFNGDPPNGQGDPGPDLRVLIAQLSVAQGQTVSGSLSVFARIGAESPPLIVEFPNLEFVCEGGTVPCNGACPTDIDGDGETGAFDLAMLLGCWGPITPGAICECLDSDGNGDIGPFDLAQLLGSWGLCD